MKSEVKLALPLQMHYGRWINYSVLEILIRGGNILFYFLSFLREYRPPNHTHIIKHLHVSQISKRHAAQVLW